MKHQWFPVLAALLIIACEPEDASVTPEDSGRLVGDGGILRPDVGGPQLLDLGPPEVDADPLGPRLNSLIPNRSELAGGIRVRIIGRDFRNGVQVEIGEKACTDLELENENHLRCTVPAGEEVGVVPVTISWPGRDIEPATIEEGFTYFQRLALESIEPTTDTTRGGVEVTVVGQGFVDPTEVRFGEVAAQIKEITDSERMIVIAPPHEAGTVDVRVRNLNGDVRLFSAFTYTEELVVDRVRPRWGSVAGGDELTIDGGGLLPTSTVRLGGVEATVLASELNRQRLRVRTPPHAPGLVDLEVVNTNGESREDDVFLYVPDQDGAFEVLGVVPNRLPDTGGHPFEVGGNGFTEATEVAVDGQRVPCDRISAQVLSCRSPLHDPGLVDVAVTEAGRTINLPDSLRFFPAVEVFDVRPPRGSRAGNTLVQLRGRGFSPAMELSFDGSPLTQLEVVSPEEAWARTPGGREGVVNLVTRTPDDVAFLPEAYEYFDPTNRSGGVWGEPIQWSVNVTVLDAYTGDPVADVQTMAIRVDTGRRYQAFTNVDGQAVISDRDLRSPVNVTISKVGYEAFTIERVTAENVTAYIIPAVPPELGEAPPRDPIPPSRVSGTVRGIDLLEKPLEPGLVLAAFVETTHASMFNRSGLPWSEPNGILLEDGPFEIFCRPGQIALIVTAGYVPAQALDDYRSNAITYWGMRDQLVPLAMGYQRYISVSPGDAVQDISLVIDKPMNIDVPVTLDNPSGGVPGAPSLYDVEVFIDFGAEGWWALDTRAEGPNTQMLVPHMPDMTTWEPDMGLYWVSNARQASADWMPYTTSFEWDRDVLDGVVIGPFVGTPHVISPQSFDGITPGSLRGAGLTIEWELYPGADGPTEPADATILSLSTSRGTALWTYITPGAVTRYTLPFHPEELEVVPPEDLVNMYFTVVPVIVDRRFDYEDFGLGDLGFGRRASYGVARATFDP